MPSTGGGRPPSPRLVAVVVLALLAGGLAACGTADGPPRAEDPLVVATTSVLGDVVGNVVGDAGTVETLMPPGSDPHAFEPSPAQIGRLREADLVVANGLGLEEGLGDALAAAEADGVPVLRVGEHLDPQPLPGAAGDGVTGTGDPTEGDGVDGREADGDDHGHGTLDPHVWLDPVRMADAVAIIGDRLGQAVPGIAEPVGARADAERDELLALHAEVGRILDSVPEGRRSLVTDHAALGYLADRYGFTVVGALVPGGSTLAAPSGRRLAALVEAVRRTGAGAVFTDTTGSSRLAEAVRSEVGGQVRVVALHTGSLGEPGSDAGTYRGMMELNARRIADALTG